MARLIYRHVATAPDGQKVMRNNSPTAVFRHAVLGMHSREYDERKCTELSEDEIVVRKRSYGYLCALRDGKYEPKQRSGESIDTWKRRVASDIENAKSLLDGIEDFDGFLSHMKKLSLAAIEDMAARGYYRGWVSLGFYATRQEAEDRKASEEAIGHMARVVIADVESTILPKRVPE